MILLKNPSVILLNQITKISNILIFIKKIGGSLPKTQGYLCSFILLLLLLFFIRNVYSAFNVTKKKKKSKFRNFSPIDYGVNNYCLGRFYGYEDDI